MIWLYSKFTAGRIDFVKTSLDIPILIFVGWILLTIPFATDPIYSFGEWRKTFTRFLMFWFIVNVVNSEKQVCSVLAGLSVGVAMVGLMDAFYFFREGGAIFDMSLRAGNVAGGSQWLSMYLIVGLPILWLGFTCYEKSIVRAAYAIALGIALVALFLAHTRAAWIAIIVQVLLYMALRFTRNRLIAGLVVIGSVGLLLTALTIPGKHRELISSNEFTHPRTMLVRFDTWKFAIDDIREHLVTGIGFGKHSFYLKHPNIDTKFHTHIHNSFFSTAVQIGIPGFVFFCWIFLAVIKYSSDSYQAFPGQFSGQLAMALVLVCIGVVIRNLFDDLFWGNTVYLFWLFAGLSFALNKPVNAQNEIEKKLSIYQASTLDENSILKDIS